MIRQCKLNTVESIHNYLHLNLYIYIYIKEHLSISNWCFNSRMIRRLIPIDLPFIFNMKEKEAYNLSALTINLWGSELAIAAHFEPTVYLLLRFPRNSITYTALDSAGFGQFFFFKFIFQKEDNRNFFEKAIFI